MQIKTIRMGCVKVVHGVAAFHGSCLVWLCTFYMLVIIHRLCGAEKKQWIFNVVYTNWNFRLRS